MTKVFQYSEEEAGPYEENDNTKCQYCKRKVFFDNWHYYINKNKEKKKVPHDRTWSPGMPPVKSHWDHCPALHKEDSQPMQPIGPAKPYQKGEDVTIATQEDIDKMNEAIKTLEVKFEVLTASFNDYVNLTMKAIKGFLDDVHNNMTTKERIEVRAEGLIDSTKKIVIDESYSHDYNKMDAEDKKRLDGYFKGVGENV